MDLCFVNFASDVGNSIKTRFLVRPAARLTAGAILCCLGMCLFGSGLALSIISARIKVRTQDKAVKAKLIRNPRLDGL